MIEWIFLTVLFIWGVHAIFEYPFIFWRQGEWLDRYIPKMIRKPLYRCPVCMSSIWGTYFFLYSDQSGIMNWIVFVFAVCGVNFLIVEYLYPGNNELEVLEKEQKKQ